mgnify:CR=1 FL=1
MLVGSEMCRRGSDNIIVAKKDWETSPKADGIKKVIAAYHTDDVKKVIEETSDGLDQPVW